jgi:putative ABC transport system permease protein
VIILSLAWQSVKSRIFVTTLTVLSIALSVGLLIGVNEVQLGTRQSFEGTISHTDLVVGARGGSLELLLYTVFHMGSELNDISYESYQHFASSRAVAWTIPFDLGDSHKGFRVVGTDDNFYQHYTFHGDQKIHVAQGTAPQGVFDAVIGSDVAEKLHYQLGQQVVLSHGLSSVSFSDHKDKPFTVVGILQRTATPVDRAIYVSLYGIEAMHIDWKNGAPPLPGQGIAASTIRKEDIKIDRVSSFLIGTKSRMDGLRLQREINTYKDEALTAILPGVTLSELWQMLDYADNALSLIAVCVLIVGLLGMMISLYALLNERRREIAILRALGTSARQVVVLLMLESTLLSALGALLGVGVVFGALFVLQTPIEMHFGLYLPIVPLSRTMYLYLAAVVVAGALIGFVPGVKAYRNSLIDGLSTTK